MKLTDGMLVKRKDNGLKGVVHKLQGGMWKVKYHDGTHTYTTELSFEKNFILPTLEVEFEDDSKCDGFEPKTDLIDKQEHYTNNGIQPIEIMKANMTKEKYRGFLEGNILKYPLRYEDKNGLDDLKKAKTYLTWLIEDIEERGL
nr:MAG TPA: nucelotide kinase [Caudoviricetes sp.]